MRVITPGTVNISHVMWQPVNGCTRNCKGCYSNQSLQEKGYGGSELLHLMFSNEPEVVADQLTVGLDTLDNVPIELGNSLIELWEKKYIFQKKGPLANLPDLCVTCRDFETLSKWIIALDMSLHEFLYPISVLSFSDDLPKDVTQHGLTREACGTTLNRNLLVTEIEEHPFDFSPLFDSVYITLFKHPIGTLPPKKEGRSYLANWCETILKSDEAFCKVIPDSCVVEALKWKFEHKACSAGIDKVHVWAKGAVTGCPYDPLKMIHRVDKREVNPNLFLEIEAASDTQNFHLPIKQCLVVNSLDRLWKSDKKLVQETMKKLGLDYLDKE